MSAGVEIADRLRASQGLPAAIADAAFTATPLPSLTNRTFRIECASGVYALRLSRPGSAAIIDRHAEFHNAVLAAELGLAPAIVFFDPADGLMLTRFVEGAGGLSPAAMRQPDRLAAASALLRRLHDSGARFRGEMDLFAMLDRYLAIAGPEAPAARALAAARIAMRPVQSALEAHRDPMVACHIDPTPDNFLDAPGRLYLIDWEYAAMCEALWDLAGLSIEAGLDTDADAFLLHSYFGAPTQRQEGRFLLLKASLDLLAAAWDVVQATQGNPSGDFAGDAQARLARVEAALGEPGLGRRLAAAR
jgi:thiamine kinase-like enzyme